MGKKKAPPRATAEANPFELAAVVSDRVQIKDVRITECSARHVPPPGEGILGLQAFNKVDVEVSIDENEDLILVRPRFSFHASGSGDDDQGADSLLSIECSFLLTYSAPSVGGLTHGNLEAFAQINGIFNAWPYWREFVQNMAARMGLPQLVIPVFRFGE